MGLNTVVKLIYFTHLTFLPSPLLSNTHAHISQHTPHSHTHRLVSMFLFLSRCRCSPSRAPEDLSVETSTSMGNRYITSCVMAAPHTLSPSSPPHLPSSPPLHTHTLPLLPPLHTHPLSLLSTLTLSPSSPHSPSPLLLLSALPGHPVLHPAQDGDQSLA